MAYKLTTENVRIIESKLLSDLEYWGVTSEDAEKTLTYIAGAKDMADAVVKAIKELGGK